jgi:SAM-dependent methyltransferase
MPFRATFDCLWCGAAHTCRGQDDLEGWAQLCPTCVGKAGENGFLRFRLRAALRERSGAASADTGPPTARAPVSRPAAAPAAPGPGSDDWYLRRGAFSQGPIHDAAWNAELDAAGRWLDGQPWAGEIVELVAGTGWWSPLLAPRGQLSVYDTSAEALDRARERLVAHGLRAHLHLRDPWAEPDRQVDGLFLGPWLARLEPERVDAFLALARRWLKPGGRLAVLDAAEDGATSWTPDALAGALESAGFEGIEVTTTGRFFVLGSAVAS